MYTDQGKCIGDYFLVKGIGEGAFSKVYKATKRNSNEIYAVKVIQKRYLESANHESPNKKRQAQLNKRLFDEQIMVMETANSDFVLKLIEKIQSPQKYYLILQFCQGSNLEQTLQMHGKLQQNQAIHILKQILCGIITLHLIPVVHRDLKPQNILQKQGRYKIGDLGFARILFQLDQVVYTTLGTPAYMAPQIIKGHPYDRKVDIWSLGVIFYRMIYGKLPYNYKSSARISMIETLESTKVQYPDVQKKGIKQFIKSCLQINPEVRINWRQIMEHPLIIQSPCHWINNSIILNQSLSDFRVKIPTEFMARSNKVFESLNKSSLISGKSTVISESDAKQMINQYQNIEYLMKQYQKYNKRLMTEKIKILFLFENLIKLPQNLTPQFDCSRRLLELRLIIGCRCISKCQYFLKILAQQNPKNLLKFQHFEHYSRSYQFKIMREEFKLIKKECEKVYNKISQKLRTIQDKFTHKVKDFFKEIFEKEKYTEKQLMLQGIPSLDYKEEDHINYTIKFIRDPENRMKQKLVGKITACKQMYLLAFALCSYRQFATSDNFNDQFLNIILQKYKISSQTRSMDEWRKIISQQLSEIM